MLAATLTLADKKRLEIARALATRPRLLLLDEAMSGLTPLETTAAVQLVRRIHEELGVTICVVEHVMEVVMPLSHRVVVLDYGDKIADGPPQAVVRDEQVITRLPRRAPCRPLACSRSATSTWPTAPACARCRACPCACGPARWWR